MNQKRLDQEDRLEMRYRHLHTRQPICVACGESDPFCLELHHIAGRKHHEHVSTMCRNCHCKLTNQQHDHPTSSDGTRDDKLTALGRDCVKTSREDCKIKRSS